MSNAKSLSFDNPAYHYKEPLLKVFRIHPVGITIRKAEKTLNGKANKGALTWCGPYGSANEYGWWVYPGFDADIICHEKPSDNTFTGRWGGNFSFNIQGYNNDDLKVMSDFEDKIKNQYNWRYTGKQHYSVDEPEKNCISLWTGCVFQMPQDWALMIKTPTNIGLIYDEGAPACVQEGILEVDWMRYDIWTNFKFHTYEKPLRLRRNQDWPIAQLIPIHKSCYEQQWEIQEMMMDPDDPECQKMYERYAEYNFKKWELSGGKDPFCFRKLRKSENNGCPIEHLQ